MQGPDSPDIPPAKADSPAINPTLPLVDPDGGEERLGDEMDNAVPSYGYDQLPVVGLGGSAGSIPALGRFFASTPAQSGHAYVVILHLAPDHHSMLPEILQRQSAIPVHAAIDGQKIEVDHVYVIPPGKHLTTNDGSLRLTPLQPEHGKRVAVDLFFRSLADTHGPHAVAIVFSGVDGDGALGLKRIKERGGLTIAQDPSEAEQPSMPNSAIATGMVDWVLRSEDMPERIAGYQARERRLQLPSESAPLLVEPHASFAERERLLLKVLDFLRARTGHDFSYYKRATIVRRISRRMQVSGVDSLDEYLEVLRMQPGESGALVSDLLISVTNFFRDRDAFDALQAHIPRLFENKRSDGAVRVWVSACATGEEAYSIGMLLLEHARTLDSPPNLQVFACDLDDDAIRYARAGLYPATIAADVSEARLKRFFTKVPKGYIVRRELREMVLFATHDLLKDAPFSRLDMVSCRNLLIYLNREAQARCFEIFNFALNPGGYLFLGTSEMVPDDSTLFSPVDRKHRIFRQLPVRNLSVPITTGRDTALQRVLQQQERIVQTPSALPSNAFALAQQPALAPKALLAGTPASNELHFRLLGLWGPPSVVVNGDYDIVHLSENASAFFQFPAGEPTRNLLRLALPALRVALRSALLEAQQRGMAVMSPPQLVAIGGSMAPVELRVVPAGELAQDHFLILFETPRDDSGEQPPATLIDANAEAVVQHMEQKLARAAIKLQTTIEQYEASSEELKASNEELQAMNEELRSAGEELESGREELQSVNEELTTLNAESKNRVEELSRANSDLHNLMSATQIATVFLDRSLRIMRYTPSAAPLFNLIAGDIGRPLSDLNLRVDYPELKSDAAHVLEFLVPIEREVRADDGWRLVRLLPYRTLEDHIAGVVLTFVDISERKSYEASRHASGKRLQTLADAVPQIIWTNTREGNAVYFNQRWYDYSGCSPEESVGPGWQAIVHPDDAARAGALWQHALITGEAFDCEYRLQAADGSYRWFLGRNVPTRGADGKVDGWFGTATDIDEIKNAEASLRASEEQFRRAIEDAPIPVIMQAEDGEVLQISKTWMELTGFAPEEIPTFDAWLNRAYGPGAETVRTRMHDLFSGDVRVLDAEFDVRTRSDDERHWIFSASAPGTLRDGRRYVVGMVSDITDKLRAEEQLRASQEQLRLTLENARDYAIITMDLERRITNWSAGAESILGYGPDEVRGGSVDMIYTPEDCAAGAPEREAAEALASGRASDERWHVRKDGTRFWGSGVMLPLRDREDGSDAHGLVKIFRDHTNEMLALENMRRARAELRDALQATEVARDQAQAAVVAKDRFLAILSHELRTPLTPVLLGTQMLARAPGLSDAARDTLAVIERNVRLQARLVDDLLDVSRVANGKVEWQFAAMDLHAAIMAAIDISRSDFNARQQTLDVRLAASAHAIVGDFTRIQQVFWNILKNASKFSPEGGHVEIDSRNEEGCVIVEIRDNGAGFEADAAERIFVAFEQASTGVSSQFGGLGLGLAIVNATVLAHGGSVRAHSNGAGTGATFTVSLPLAAAD